VLPGRKQQKKVVESLRKKIQERLRTVLVQNTGPQEVVLSVENGRLALRLSATRFFDSAQASLRPDALPVLTRLPRSSCRWSGRCGLKAHR